jgi:hypothetical protein
LSWALCRPELVPEFYSAMDSEFDEVLGPESVFALDSELDPDLSSWPSAGLGLGDLALLIGL